MAAKLITFGAPRIGNRAFAEYISSHFVESYRIVYRRDSIPHLPIRSLGYVHADTEVWFEFINKKK
jgi:predicted lipase